MRKSQYTDGVDLDPKASAERLAAASQKDREYHRLHAAEYDQSVTAIYRIYHHWDLHPWIARAARRHPTGFALDVGAGTGAVALALARARFRVVALDHSPEMLVVGAGRAREDVVLRPCAGDVLKLPFAANSFEVVTMQGILHHVPIALEELLAEAERVLKPGGEFYISEPCSDASLVGRILRNPLWFQSYDPEGEETDEELIGWKRLSKALDGLHLKYKVRFLTHVPFAHFHYWLPDWLRLQLTLLLSVPFRRGDILFVHGHKVG